MSSRRWRRAALTSRGTTSRRTRPSCGRTAASGAPFRLQFYCNGHSSLARQLTAEGIGFTAADNAFIRIDDWQRAQDLADRLSPDRLHLALDRYAAQCCPMLDVFRQSYHGSLM